ncbi:MAG: sugar phosphate isomerase/epimerase [Provencibacterium sp.]|jgi:sugar phosphate isomerase/epimerase|nr:sugar phosphate isomerase/epimerase [Provencibacterium sp.]
MKLGVFTTLLSNLPLEEALKYFQSLGIQMVEIGCGNFPGNAHCNPQELLESEEKRTEFLALIQKYGMQISALSCHGNPVHPNKEIAGKHDKVMRDTVLLAEQLGIHQINCFSGCPGDHEGAKYPNWVTCPWPEDFSEILEWQWNEVLIPYWKEFVAFSKAHGVDKIALELHPGFCVYNTHSLLKLREAVGPEIGANLDPSHLIWQGMDPVAVIKALGNAIFHFHAKDTRIDKYNTAVNGVLDTRHYSDEANRSWIFRSVGYGNDYLYWKDIISALRVAGYDYAISIEHEDSLMSQNEGLSKAVSFLKQVITFEGVSEMWWA